MDVTCEAAALNHFWFLGSGAGQTITGFFVDEHGDQTGNSFSLSINAADGSSFPLSLASVSGGIPVDTQPSQYAPIAFTGASNASPIVITGATAHGMVNGQQVVIAGVAGNTAANGTWFIKYISSSSFSLYQDSSLLLPVAGNGTTGAGTATPLGQKVSAAIGAIVNFSAKTYWNTAPAPLSDFITNYANYPSYSSADGNVPISRVNVN